MLRLAEVPVIKAALTVRRPDTPLRSRNRAALGVVLVAAWCALAAGLLEGARHLIWRYGLDRLVWMSVDVYWLAPVSYLAFFAVPAGLLAALAWARPRWAPPWLAVAAFGSVGAFGVLSLLGRNVIAIWAIALLALGVGAQLARLARSRPAAMWSAMRRTLPVMAGVVLVLMGWALAGRPVYERLRIASLAAAPAGAPNVLFIILDTVRGQNLSLYGYGRPTTPNLERLGNEGVVFEHAISPAPWTLPAHASMFTGRWPHELSADWQRPLDGAQRTLAESLRERGYVTAGFVANLIYTGRDAGLARGFIHYRGRTRSARQVLLSSFLGQTLENLRTHWWTFYPVFDRKLGSDVSGEFLAWLDEQGDRPFFTFLNYYDAHLPYYAPPEYRQRFRSANAQLGQYDAAIAYIDDQLGRLFGELKRRGVLDNTIVVVASDHGDLFGEHGLYEHGNSLYDALIRVPLVIRYPAALPAGQRVGTIVSLRDLPATLTELTGGRPVFPGRSLAPLWSAAGGRRAPELVLSEVSRAIRGEPHEPASKGDMKSLYGEPFHYIRNADGREELYDVRQDQGEDADLASSRAVAPVTRRLSAQMDEVLSASGSRPKR